MSDPTITAPIDEITKLRARIRELETQLSKPREAQKGDEDRDRASTRRVGDTWSDVTQSKLDVANRMVRGVTLASATILRDFSDTVASFAGTVVSRNESRVGENRSTRDLVTRLPEDIATSMADAVDRAAEIPARAMDEFSKGYREGEKAHTSRRPADASKPPR